MSDRNSLLLLEAHRENLASAKSFEEYREQHLAYVDCLIQRFKAERAKDEAGIEFIYRTACEQMKNKDASEGPAP